MSAVARTSDWLKTRINNIDIFDEHFQNEAKTNPFYALGPIFYLVWFIVMLTGLVLIMWYVPTKANAFDSILGIQHHVLFGSLWRGVHKYGADAMIIAATMRLFRMFLCGDYKPGRELNIAIGLVTLLLSMYSGLTGYLLIWNQRAFWATKVFATFPTYMDQFPVMGDFYLPLVKSLHLGWNTAEFLLGAGGAITQETITRFFSLHLAFSLIPLIFVELYFYKNGYTRIPLSWLKRIIITMMLVVTAMILPAAIGARSNPDVTPLPILSDWYFLGLYQMYKYLEPVVATEITLLIPLTVVAIPFIDVWITGPEKDWRKRPLVFMTTIMGFVNWVIFSFLIIYNIANIHTDPPYWRDFLFLMVDAGIIWQCWLIWKTDDLKEKAKAYTGAMIMGVLGLLQTITAAWFYFMAKTEMFFSPLSQAFAYWLARPLMGASADAAEAAVREAIPKNVEYWNWAAVMSKGGDFPGKPAVEKVAEIAQQATPLDFLFQAIPTFVKDPAAVKAFLEKNAPASIGDLPEICNTLNMYIDKYPDWYPLSAMPDLQYRGMMDFMLSNRWCFDYVTFCDRMNGVVKPYPLPVPELDWLWMLGGAAAMAVAFWTAMSCRAKPQEAAQASAQPATPQAG